MKLKTPKFAAKGQNETRSQKAPFAPTPQPPTMAQPTQAVVSSAPVSPLKKAANGLAAPTRQRNAALMIAGAAFIVLSAAMAASVASSFDDSIEVLVASSEIAEGQPVMQDDFRAVRIAAGAGDIQAVSPASIADLVGRVAAGPIGEGSMIHPAQFAVFANEAQVVVGAALQPDQYPATGLKPGDQVRLIEVADRYGGGDDEGAFSAGREITIGEVTDVVRLRSSDNLHFSIRVGESAASVVAQRVAQDRLTIALVDDSRVLEQVDPTNPVEPVVPFDLDDETDQ